MRSNTMANSDKKRNKSHYHGDDEVIQRNMEQARELIEARRSGDTAELDPETLAAIEASAPDAARDSTPPNQTDVPIGGTTGPNARGGSSKRHKP
jgi:hypothetical protein